MKKVLIICVYPKDKAPAQRFRFEQYIPYLSEQGFDITFSSLLNEKEYAFFYKKGNYFKKMVLVLKSIFKRLKEVRTASDYDLVFISREGFFLGTSYFERQFAKKTKIIYDFDDAIWITIVLSNNKWLKSLKNESKTKQIIEASEMVFAGNTFLGEYAKQFNNNVVIVPTTIDTDLYVPGHEKNKEQICIGWSGSFSTIVHFNTCIDALKMLKNKYGEKIYFKVIGSGDYRNEELDIQGIPWSKESEISELQEINIGIMPLPDTEWTKGKCGLKGLQYMALGIPTVMSPVGVNSEIIEQGVNGFLASDTGDWVKCLSLLIDSPKLRKDLGEKGRETVLNKYSVNTNKNLYLEYFNKAIGH